MFCLESAKKTFNTSTHLEFTVTPGKYVVGKCGRFVTSIPLGWADATVENAKEKIRQQLLNCHETESTTIKTQTANVVATIESDDL